MHCFPPSGGKPDSTFRSSCVKRGVLDEFGVELIGAKLNAIKIAEDRRLFRDAIEEIGLEVPRSGFANSLKEANAIIDEIGLPAVIRPSFTLGGSGGRHSLQQ